MAMTPAQRNELIVGLVFFAALLLLFIYTVVISGVFKGRTKTYLVSFPNVYGLKEGDKVRVEGLDVGEVKELRLVEKPSGELRINARLVVRSEVEIYKVGSEIKVIPFSPLGGHIVEIQRGNADSPFGKFDSVEEMKARGQEPVPITGFAAGELLLTLSAIVEENKESVTRIVKNLEIVSDRLTKPDSGVVGMLLNDKGAAVKMDEITNELRDAAHSLNVILARLERGEGVLGELTKKEGKLHDDVVGAADAARGTLDEARKILKNANDGKSALGVLVASDDRVSGDVRGIAHDLKLITSDVQAGTGTVGKLFKDDRLYEGATATAQNLGKITKQVDEGKGAVGVLLSDADAGRAVKSTLLRLDSIAKSIDEKEGALGLVIKDRPFRDRVAKIFEEVERTVIEFRDSVEDLREQAPINAFIGAIFAAF